MAITLGDIILLLGADDSRLNATLKGVEGKAQSWVNGLGGKLALGLGGIITGAIGGATALGLAAFKAGSDLDAAYDTIIAKSGASGEALQELQNDFKSVFTAVPTMAIPAAEVLSVLHQRTTLVGDANEKLAKQLLESARIMGGDAKVNTELYTRMMGDWSISNDQASVTLDKVFVASQKTGIGMDRLMQLAVQFGSPMRLMGFSIDDTIALLSKWEKEGVNTELVMGSLRIAAGKFADEGKPLRESLLATFESIKSNTDATAALSEGMDVFGARAGPDMVAAIREGRFEFEDLLDVLGDAGNSINETAAKTMDWGEKLTILKNKATLALAPIGMRLMDLASAALDRAGPALDKFADIVDRHVVPAIDSIFESIDNFDGDPIGAVADILYKLGYNLETVFGIEGANDFFSNLADGFVSLTQTAGTFISGTLIPFVRDHWPELKGALIGIGIALTAAGIVTTVTAIGAAIAALLNPVGLLIAGAALLGAAWAGNWGGIRDKTAAAIEFISGRIQMGIDFWTALFEGRLGMLSAIFMTVWLNIRQLFAAFQAAMSGDWYTFGALLRQVWDNTWNLIKAVVTIAWVNIKTAISNGIQNAKTAFTQTDWGSVGRNIIEGIARGITGGLSTLRTAAMNAARAALEAAKGFLGIKSPSTVFAEEVGKPSAEGFGRGFTDHLGDIGPGLGGAALDPFGGTLPSVGGASGGIIINFEYIDQRFISLSDEFDAERVLRPIVQRIMRGAPTPA